MVVSADSLGSGHHHLEQHKSVVSSHSLESCKHTSMQPPLLPAISRHCRLMQMQALKPDRPSDIDRHTRALTHLPLQQGQMTLAAACQDQLITDCDQVPGS